MPSGSFYHFSSVVAFTQTPVWLVGDERQGASSSTQTTLACELGSGTSKCACVVLTNVWKPDERNPLDNGWNHHYQVNMQGNQKILLMRCI